MNLQRTLLIAALSAPLLALATGCSVARKQETVGEYIDGAAITTEVKAKLASMRKPRRSTSASRP